ncbi:MAG TPA: hypothetical protein VK211_29175 [Kamptonema sp.]|nr:hypothetical protein [Kamptonema sp.]
MELGAEEISINALRQRYGIKQAAAYKWRSALRNLGMEESWENYDRVNNREINLSEAAKGSAIAVAAPSKVRQAKPTAVSVSEPVAPQMIDSGFGLSIGRLRELNSEAELEVLVKSKLRDYHESNLQSQRSQELKSRIEEVKEIDPKNLGAMLLSLGV